MNSRKSIYDIKSFYNKKAILKASFQGMRYQLGQYKDPEQEEAAPVLRVTIWPEPFCFEVTPDEQKGSKQFDFSEEGLCEAIAWLNENHDTYAQKKQ